MYYEKELQKANQVFRVDKVINGKGNKLYVKWEGYNNLFNSWIDKQEVGDDLSIRVLNLLL